MSSSLTLGPWIASRCNVVREDGIEVATAWAQGSRNDEDSFAIAEANARLMAAAPELLEACKVISERMPKAKQKMNERETAAFNHHLEVMLGWANAAIAKSEGSASAA